MEAAFWQERWDKNEIGFHKPHVHELLVKHFSDVAKHGTTVFVPLCGKSNDMRWLLDKGYRVFGVELNENAVKQVFKNNQLTPKVTEKSGFKEYAVDDLVIWVGDFFNLEQDDLAHVDAWYDRAAMIALPPEMRRQYVLQLCKQLPERAKGLLITIDYPKGYRKGPPFSVGEGEVEIGYGQRFSIEQLEVNQVGLDGQEAGDNPITEQVYRLD
ncbi:MAG: thiopurine S-methyltransferase [Pseudomonadota bacterium]